MAIETMDRDRRVSTIPNTETGYFIDHLSNDCRLEPEILEAMGIYNRDVGQCDFKDFRREECGLI